MFNIRKIARDIIYIGASDRRLALFESAYPIPNGVSYNSYLIKDDKTVLMDTVDKSCAEQFYQNLKAALGNRTLDYLVVQHMEPDHAALVERIINKYPSVKIICTAKTVGMIKQFFNFDIDSIVQTVKEGDTFNTGHHNLTFVMAPMVHWPEVMVTYDTVDKILFSADAFGSFGAINGNLYDNEINFKEEYIDEARRYYTNIVGKYGLQVQMLLKKASGLDIKMICPLHGVIVKENIGLFVEKYSNWSNYTSEEKSLLIAYSSVYGNTENVVELVAAKLADKGIKNIKMFDTSYTHHSYILSEAFRVSHIVLATTTYNAGIFESMESFLNSLVAHNLQKRKFALIQNGTWVPTCGNLIKEKLEKLKESEIISEIFNIKSSLKDSQIDDIDNLVESIYNSIK